MAPQSSAKGLMIAAPSSGSGKTLITLALLRALKHAGHDIAAAKAGPDYIDPAFHALACETSSINLDPWAMEEERVRSLADGQSGDFLLVEAMMGLFDGAADGSGSAADLADTLGANVILVIDAAKQSHSIAALVRGFRDHRADLKVCGVILNKVGSARHEAMLLTALAEIDMPVFGVVIRDESLVLPERHLGLIQAGELDGIESFIDNAAKIIGASCDLDALVKVASGLKEAAPIQTGPKGDMKPLGQRIAIARDEAFSFIYPHLLRDWKMAGAEVSFFSPLADEAPDESVDAIYLPGGYPELHAAKLSSNEKFKRGMLKAASKDSLIYGECGGYMVLGEGIIDSDGQSHAMLGLLNLETSFAKRKLHLGYRKLQGLSGFFEGQKFAAHEFHYTSAIREEGEALFEAHDALNTPLGKLGLRSGHVMGSYMHLIDERL